MNDTYFSSSLELNILLRLNKHISVTTSVLKDRFSKYDRGGTGDISFDDFLSLMQVKLMHMRLSLYALYNNPLDFVVGDQVFQNPLKFDV